MIYLYSGTPGSGKSLHASKDIIQKLRRKQSVIANFDINLDVVKQTFRGKIWELIQMIFKTKKKTKKYQRKIGEFVYKDNSKLTVDYLQEYAKKHHKKGREGQTLIVIDECAVLFNSREWNKPGRYEWIKFFQMHRHYGYNIILVSQNDRLIDRQIRAFIEYDVKHRKANNLGFIGMLITMLGMHLFAAVTYWYGIREKLNTELFIFKKIYKELYDSYSSFENDNE